MPFKPYDNQEQFKPILQDRFKQEKKSLIKQVADTADKVGDFLGIKKFGQAIGTASYLYLTKDGRDLLKNADKDPSKAQALYEVLREAPSSKEIVGSAALTALNIASAGTLQGAGAGMQSFRLVPITKAGRAAAGINTAVKSGGALARIGKSAALGGAFGVAGAMEQNKGFKEGVKQTATLSGISGGLTGVGVGINKGKQFSSKVGQKIAGGIMNTTIKPTLEESKKSIKYGQGSLGQEMLKRNIKGSNKQIYDLAIEKVDELENQLDNVLKNSKLTISRNEIAKYFKKTVRNLQATPTPEAKKEIEFIKSYLVTQLPKQLSLADANTMKRNLYKQIGEKAFNIDPKKSAHAPIYRTVANALKQEIEKKAQSNLMPTGVDMLQKNLAPQLGVHSKEAQRIVSKIDFTKARNLQEAVQMVNSALPENLRKNPSIQSAITNWSKSAQMVQREFTTDQRVQEKTVKGMSQKVRDINKEMGFYLQLRDRVLDKMAKSEKAPAIGFKDVVAGGAGGYFGGIPGAVAGIGIEKALASTGVRTYSAATLNKIAQRVDKIPTDKFGRLKISKTALLNLLNTAMKK